MPKMDKTEERLHQILYILLTILLILVTLLALKTHESRVEASKELKEREREFYWVATPPIEITEDTPIEELKAPETPFLEEEEVVVIDPITPDDEERILPIEKLLFKYVEVIDGCGPYFNGDCLNVRSGPGTDYPVVRQMRNGVVLRVEGKVENDGHQWYKIIFDEWLRYPERAEGDWYIASEFVKVLLDEGDKTTWEDGVSTSSEKHIIVDRSEQRLYAYEGDTLAMELDISTGLEFTPTPRGTFTIFKKTPSRYMQGPLPGLSAQDEYDLPGVPWNMYFTEQGAVIHGAYWHDKFGSQYSHGCVNVATQEARDLYYWTPLGTQVVVRD